MKGFLLILFGLFIDGLQAMLTFAGGALMVANAPMGVAFGIVSEVALTLTFGAGFLLVLAMAGMFSPTFVIPVFLGEMLPGLSVLPGWTALAIASVVRQRAKEGKGGLVQSVTATLFSAIPGAAADTAGTTRTFNARVAAAPTRGQEQAQTRNSLQPLAFARSVDGIRAANDNTKPHAKAA